MIYLSWATRLKKRIRRLRLRLGHGNVATAIERYERQIGWR